MCCFSIKILFAQGWIPSTEEWIHLSALALGSCDSWECSIKAGIIVGAASSKSKHRPNTKSHRAIGSVCSYSEYLGKNHSTGKLLVPAQGRVRWLNTCPCRQQDAFLLFLPFSPRHRGRNWSKHTETEANTLILGGASRNNLQFSTQGSEQLVEQVWTATRH